MNEVSRIAYVDYMKAALICFVVLGHAGSVLGSFVYLFHIPAFFFVSGLLSDYSKEKEGTISSCKYMIIAIFLWNIIFMALSAICAFLLGKGLRFAEPGTSFYELIVRPVIGIVWCYYKTSPIPNPLVGQFWFVWVLVLMKLGYRFIHNFPLKFKYAMIVFCIVFAGLELHYNFRTLFYIDRMIVAFPFFAMGVLLRKNLFMDKPIKSTHGCICLLMFCLFTVCFYVFHFEKLDLFHQQLGPSVLFYYITAFAGTFSMIFVCQCISQAVHISSSAYLKQCISQAVKNISIGTFLILAVHLIMCKYVGVLLGFDPTRLILVCFIVMICYPAIVFSDKHCKILLAKRP